MATRSDHDATLSNLGPLASPGRQRQHLSGAASKHRKHEPALPQGVPSKKKKTKVYSRIALLIQDFLSLFFSPPLLLFSAAAPFFLP